MRHLKSFTISMLMTSTVFFSAEKEVTGCMNINKRSKNCNPQGYPVPGKDCKMETPETCPPPAQVCSMAEDDFRIQVGGNYTYAWITPTGNSTVSGSLAGADALFEYRPIDNIYAGLSFAYHQGTPKATGISRSLLDFDTQARMGISAGSKVCGNTRIALYTGFGGRYMSEKASAETASVKFQYVQLYVPVGIAFEHKLVSCFHWGVNAQWKPQIMPTVDIIPLAGARWILTKKLSNYIIDVPLSFFFTDNFSIVVDPFYELWHDGATIAETLAGLFLSLPGNKYTFTGVNVNLAWSL